MQSLKFFVMAFSFLINFQAIFSMNSIDNNPSEAIMGYVTIELADNQQALMLSEEFARLCEQSVTIQNHLADILNQNTVVNTEGKLTINADQFPQNYPLHITDEETFAELLSYIVFGKISDAIQDDCLCQLMNVASYLDMPQLLKESTESFAERVTNDKTLDILLNKNNFENYYKKLNISEDIQKKELVNAIAQTNRWKNCGLKMKPQKQHEFSTKINADYYQKIAISADNSFLLTHHDDNNTINMYDMKGNNIGYLDAGDSIYSFVIDQNNHIMAVNYQHELIEWDRFGQVMNRKIIPVQHPLHILDITINPKNLLIMVIYRPITQQGILYHPPIDLELFDGRTGNCINQFKFNYYPYKSKVNQLGTLLVNFSKDRIKTWDIKTGTLLQEFDGRDHDWGTTYFILDTAFTDDNYLMIATQKNITAWDPLSGKRIYSIPCDNDYFDWNTKCGKNIFVNFTNLSHTTKIISHVARSVIHNLNITGAIDLNFDDSLLISISSDGKAEIWDLVHADILHGLSLKQAQVVVLILSKKVSLNKLPHHLKEVYETLPEVVKSATSNANLK